MRPCKHKIIEGHWNVEEDIMYNRCHDCGEYFKISEGKSMDIIFVDELGHEK